MVGVTKVMFLAGTLHTFIIAHALFLLPAPYKEFTKRPHISHLFLIIKGDRPAIIGKLLIYFRGGVFIWG